jgi:S1-C subfamily serine protease
MEVAQANRLRERVEVCVRTTAALALIFWVGVASYGQVTLDKIASDNKDAMVFLRTKITLPTGEIRESTGTGFLLNSEGYVLTASHALPPAGYDRAEISGSIKTRHGQSWPMDVIEDNPRRGLLLLKFKDVDIKWSAVSLGLPTQTPVGAKLFALGYPLTEDLAAREGSLSNKNGPSGSWTTTVPLNLGDSGTPIFNDKGQVIAIVVSDIPDARGIAYCLPLNYAAELLSVARATLMSDEGSTRALVREEGDQATQYMGRLDPGEYCRNVFGPHFRATVGQEASCTDGLSIKAFLIAEACDWAYGSEDYTVELDSASVWCSIKNTSKPPCRSDQRICGASLAICCPRAKG